MEPEGSWVNFATRAAAAYNVIQFANKQTAAANWTMIVMMYLKGIGFRHTLVLKKFAQVLKSLAAHRAGPTTQMPRRHPVARVLKLSQGRGDDCTTVGREINMHPGMSQLQEVLKQWTDVLEAKVVTELMKLPECTAETGAIDFQDY
ncbi:unnamed protein product, partial [Symbiodinium sp. KB8]